MMVRAAEVQDAASLVDHVSAIADEPDNNIVFGPGEFTMSVSDEEAYISAMRMSDNTRHFVALDSRGLLGECSIRGRKFAATRRTALLGITVRTDARGQGVGTALLTHALSVADDELGLLRIELNVLVRNEGARRLYERFGFEIEGRLRRAILKPGGWQDEYVMARLRNE